METIKRKPAPRHASYPVGFFWIRFVSGGKHDITVNPDLCPRNLHARGHWREGDGEPIEDEFHGETVVLGRCLCADEAPPDWPAFCDAAMVAPDTTRTPADLAERYHRETGLRIHPTIVAGLRP